MLLQWCNLKPLGPSNLAAIRFASPCRVQAVKIFPTGVKPFANCPDIVARTEPDSFFIDVYFNAHPLPGSQDGKQKLKAPNALIPTVIAYSGGQTEFAMDMGADFGTRLMIVRGDFESVSMAVYGEVVADAPAPATSYTPGILPQLPEPIQTLPALDLANASDPTCLARQLLALIPDAPSLNLVIRLMFCLKPPNDDWDLPEFPHLYSDLNEEDIDIDLDSAFRCLSRPIAEDVPVESLQRFSEKISDAIGPMDDTQAYFVSGILCRSASQNPHFAQSLMQSIDLESVFDVANLNDADTIYTLLDASTNPDIAELFNVDWFKDMLQSVESLPTAQREVKKGARRLTARLRDWQVFGDALSNPEGNFVDACRFLKEIGMEEKSFGIWLSCMTTHDDLWASVRDGPPRSDGPFASFLDSSSMSVSHGDFLGFVKAYMGVASVLAVYAWSDSLPNDHCRERTLGVLKLWQDIPGYREVVNHLLMLRQMVFRLESMTIDNDPPAQSGIHAENIILNLVDEPRCYLSSDFVKCLRSWQPFSLTYINEEERISLHRAATIADNGALGAMEELGRMDPPMFDSGRIRGLRVAVAILLHEVEGEDGDWAILDTAWRGGVQGLVFHIIDVASSIGQELKSLCSPTLSQPRETGVMEQLLLLADELLPLIVRLEPLSVTTSRSMRSVITAIADIFTCAGLILSQTSLPSSFIAAGKRTRQTCVAVLLQLSGLRGVDSPKRGPALFLRTLFEHGLKVDTIDPALSIRQVYDLVDRLIPEAFPETAESNSRWVLSVLPLILTDMGAFFRALDIDTKLALLDRLVSLDNGTLNVGEWLLMEETKHMANVARLLGGMRDPHHSIAQYEISLCLELIARLMDKSCTHSTMCIVTICTTTEASCALTDTITSMLTARLHSIYLVQITQTLASSPSLADSDLKSAIALISIRGVSLVELGMGIGETFDAIRTMLQTVDEAELALDRLLWEFGYCLSSIAGSGNSFDSLDVQSVVRALSWLCDKLPGPSDLPGLSWDKWDKLCEVFQNGVLPDMYPALRGIKGKLTPLPDTTIPTTLMPDRQSHPLSLSIHALEEVLQPPVPVPCTPPPVAARAQRSSLVSSGDRDVLGLVALSPPTALLRSPAISGLSKTYTKNDFRELRQTPSARQNTSRMPSMHVDEFELGTVGSSPLVQPQPISTIPVPIDPSTMGVPSFGLGAPFSMS